MKSHSHQPQLACALRDHEVTFSQAQRSYVSSWHALSGGAHSCAACVSLFVSPFGQQDSKTRAAVLLTRALDRWLLVTSQLFAARVEKMLRPKRAWPQVTVNSPVGLNWMMAHDTRMITHDNTIECWKPWSNGKATVSLRLCWEENGQVELRWGEPTRVQRRWEEKTERRRERWKESWGRWKSWQVASQFPTRGQKPRKRAWKSAPVPIGKLCFWIL